PTTSNVCARSFPQTPATCCVRPPAGRDQTAPDHRLRRRRRQPARAINKFLRSVGAEFRGDCFHQRGPDQRTRYPSAKRPGVHFSCIIGADPPQATSQRTLLHPKKLHIAPVTSTTRHRNRVFMASSLIQHTPLRLLFEGFRGWSYHAKNIFQAP